MAELFIIRHAQASFGAENYDALSALGHEQAALLGAYFKARDIYFDLCVRGNLRRHKETLDYIVPSQNTDVRVDTGWNEFPFEQVVAAYLTAQPNEQPSLEAPKQVWYKILRKAMLAWSRCELQIEHETYQEFSQRVLNSANAILNSDAKKVLVVTSGGAIAMWMQHIFQLQAEQSVNLNLQIKNSSIHHFYFNREGAQMSGFNLVPHLDTAEHLNKISYS